MLRFEITKRTDIRLLERMKTHYSQPKGFVGRNICLAVIFNDTYYGHVVFGSATRFLPGRNENLGITLADLNKVANNVFYNISKVNGAYPERNFTSLVIKEAVKIVPKLWRDKYGDCLVGFETLVEKPRTGELYLKAGWKIVGETIGYTCKRIGGVSSEAWSGKRVWNKNKEELRPKKVFVHKI